LDGEVHLDFAQQNHDEVRTKKLEALGFTVIRFENKLIFERLDDVLDEISSNFRN